VRNEVERRLGAEALPELVQQRRDVLTYIGPGRCGLAQSGKVRRYQKWNAQNGGWGIKILLFVLLLLSTGMEGVQLNVPVRDSSVSCASFNQFSAIFSQRS
jgi:hypothetical protein